MLKAARLSGTQVVWDLLHFGWPDNIDIWTPAFVDRFAAFARAAARHFQEHSHAVPFWCPVNEVSFFAWGGGDVEYLNPFARGRGFELKVQLARAAIEAMHELRDIDPRARFIHCEPAIVVHHAPLGSLPRGQADGHHDSQYQACELLSGRLLPQIGGDPSFLDIVGINYYFNNQWIHGGPTIDIGHPLYRPFSDILFEVHARFGRPLYVSETGIEGDRRAQWLRYIAQEVGRARTRGVPVEGICLYPIADHPGWDDERPCNNGLLGCDFRSGTRPIHAPLAREVLQEASLHPEAVRRLAQQ
jgi:polysaccharide biosynthesis protein PelF